MLAMLVLATVRGAAGGSLASLPFSWDTLPRYTFCVSSSEPKVLSDGLFSEEALRVHIKADDLPQQPVPQSACWPQHDGGAAPPEAGAGPACKKPAAAAVVLLRH